MTFLNTFFLNEIKKQRKQKLVKHINGKYTKHR